MKRLRLVALGSTLAFCACAAWAQSTPPGYILVSGWYKDRGAQRTYQRGITPILKAHGYENAVVMGGGYGMQVLEGDWIPGAVLILLKFSSEKDAKGFWWSREYQDLKKIRATSSVLDVLQLDGVAGVKPRMNGKSAYLVFLADVRDRKRFVEEYGKLAPDVVRAHGGEFLVRASQAESELLEGAHLPGSVIVVEFPDADALKAFWRSAEYRQLSEVRKATGTWSVVELLPIAVPSTP